ncbi:TPA: poly(glycerol-phosphate) alpha-glucosyltransferase, partial [Staphylococcus aureus]
KDVIKFFTKSFFFDGEEIYELKSEGYQKGLREIDKLDVEINKMIETSSAFLKGMLNENGKYDYGYFPHFDKNINFYNILRHSSSTYALIEGLNYLN